MTSDELLDGNAGPKAQADEVLRLIDEDLKVAIAEIGLVAGNDITETYAGYPIIMVGRKTQ
jgi:hypothetical protein